MVVPRYDVIKPISLAALHYWVVGYIEQADDWQFSLVLRLNPLKNNGAIFCKKTDMFLSYSSEKSVFVTNDLNAIVPVPRTNVARLFVQINYTRFPGICKGT